MHPCHRREQPPQPSAPPSLHQARPRPRAIKGSNYAPTETTTATTQQRHPAHANPPELIPARPPRPGAAHRGHRNSQTPRESTGAAQQDASGQPNAPMLPQSNHRSQVRILLCTKLARAPVQTKAHLYAPPKTTTATHQRHPAQARTPELIPARPTRPGAAHRGHRHSQYPRESMGAAQQDASGQPNAPMLPQRATTVAKCALFSAPSSPAPLCKQKLIFTHILRRRRRRRSNDIQRTPIRPR